MPRLRIFNETDEKIVLEPGESMDIRGEKETTRVMASRMTKFFIEEADKKQP